MESQNYEHQALRQLSVLKRILVAEHFLYRKRVCMEHQTVQRPMLSKGAKRTKFYHITVILQYC